MDIENEDNVAFGMIKAYEEDWSIEGEELDITFLKGEIKIKELGK